VPKNTVLVVTREKGGFLSMLQSSLRPSKTPDPRLQEVGIMGLQLGAVVCWQPQGCQLPRSLAELV
jgi:hypothetical protein